MNYFHYCPPQSGLQLTSRLEEMRLLESRKSSRLSGQANTDFSKLADFNIVHERKRLNSEKSSDGSEFCGSVILHCEQLPKDSSNFVLLKLPKDSSSFVLLKLPKN